MLYHFLKSDSREDRIRFFAGYRLIIWLSIPIFVGILWLAVGWFSLDYDDQLAVYLESSINETYGLDSRNITLTGCMYFRPDEHGESRFCMEDSIGAFILCNLMFIPFCIICYFGFRSHLIIRGIVSKGESDYSRRIQKQLHYALLAQTAIPIIFLFVPIGVLFTAPIIGLNLEKGSLMVTFFYSFYPVVDPIPTLYFVDEFRNAFMNFFRRKMHMNQVASVVSIEPNAANAR
uniref:G protein-coupled receptor n=1 Tax=Caenorhabditis tropicalis TaxID=1561998 RepID=A0A1I7TC73_9PELO